MGSTAIRKRRDQDGRWPIAFLWRSRIPATTTLIGLAGHRSLGADDAVILEASCGCFYWVDRIKASGAVCFVLDPRRFRIITDSWNKTDRQNARNMAKALWVFLVTGEFEIPAVYKPSVTIRTLRRPFATYNLLNRQIRMLKNAIQAMRTDDGVVLTSAQFSQLFAGRAPVADAVREHSLSPTIMSSIETSGALLRQFDSPVDMSRIVLAHHERYDGTGYPQGLVGEEIPLECRIIAVADSWHAMREGRAYRRAISLEDAIAELPGKRGRQFDPEIVTRFLDGLVRWGVVSEETVREEETVLGD